MAFEWILGSGVPAQDLEVIAKGVQRHGRALAHDGHAEAIACVVRDNYRVIAGGSGRTEYQRLFISYLWVAEAFRGQGIARGILKKLESEAARRGCRDALIETLDDSVARLYASLGYRSIVEISRYVGRFNRHILLKECILSAR